MARPGWFSRWISLSGADLASALARRAAAAKAFEGSWAARRSWRACEAAVSAFDADCQGLERMGLVERHEAKALWFAGCLDMSFTAQIQAPGLPEHQRVKGDAYLSVGYFSPWRVRLSMLALAALPGEWAGAILLRWIWGEVLGSLTVGLAAHGVDLASLSAWSAWHEARALRGLLAARAEPEPTARSKAL